MSNSALDQAQSKFLGSPEAPPFTIAAFADETELDSWGTHTVENWEDAQTIAGEFLAQGAFVVVTDHHEQPINPDLWL